jgi:hypothetical protein
MVAKDRESWRKVFREAEARIALIMMMESCFVACSGELHWGRNHGKSNMKQ